MVLIRSDKMSSYMYTVETVVRGYHMYKEVWDATIGQVLPCQKEHGNVHDPYAVTVLEREVSLLDMCHKQYPRCVTWTVSVNKKSHFSSPRTNTDWSKVVQKAG